MVKMRISVPPKMRPLLPLITRLLAVIVGRLLVRVIEKIEKSMVSPLTALQIACRNVPAVAAPQFAGSLVEVIVKVAACAGVICTNARFRVSNSNPITTKRITGEFRYLMCMDDCPLIMMRLVAQS